MDHATLDAILGLAVANAEKRLTTILDIPCAVRSDGDRHELVMLEEVIAEHERRQPAPARRYGVSHHTCVASLVAHMNRFGSSNTTIWGDAPKRRIVVIYEYSTREQPAWADHRAVLELREDPRLRRWRKKQDIWMEQEEFADFVAERTGELVSPSSDEPDACAPGELVRLAEFFELDADTKYSRRMDRATGAVALVASVTNTKRNLPRGFVVEFPVFSATETPRRITGHVACRVRDGLPVISLRLLNLARHMDSAFEDVLTEVSAQTGIEPFQGRPEPPPPWVESEADRNDIPF